MYTSEYDKKRVLDEVKVAVTTRADLMKIEHVRHMTWGVVNEYLKQLVKDAKIVATKDGWKRK